MSPDATVAANAAETTTNAASSPRVSCIMPTRDRRPFVPLAIAQFLAQDYTGSELVVVDDGNDPIADLIPDEARIRYLRLDRRATVGAKRNFACEVARGQLIVHWDDDDWHARWRVSYQVDALDRTGADICGVDQMTFYDPAADRAWDYRYPGPAGPWLAGGSFCYRRCLWDRHRFTEVNNGEDTRFIRSLRGARIERLDRSDFYVARIHPGNTCPKRTGSRAWRPAATEAVRARIADFADAIAAIPAGHAGQSTARALPRAIETPEMGVDVARQPAPLTNVYACLVHEEPDCVVDLIRNLRAVDQVAPILLYDGSSHGRLLDERLPWERWGCERVPKPRPMRWGALHDFALDCVTHLGSRDYDILTIVDSDQLALRPGYAAFLARRLDDRSRLGVLSKSPERQTNCTAEGPAKAALAERALWKPFLSRFADGEEKFVHWTFWPGTVVFAEAARAVRKLFADPQLQQILARSKLWATEEVLLPTLASLLGFRIAANPCRQDWVQYRRQYTRQDLATALAAPEAFWLHPVPRRLTDPVREHIRGAVARYRSAPPAIPAAQPFSGQLWPTIVAMRAIPGWLADEEAELLLLAARTALSCPNAARQIVEIGTFCGKATLGLATIAHRMGGRVVTIDRFDGVVGARDAKLDYLGPTRSKFEQVIRVQGLSDVVDVRVGAATDMISNEIFDLAVIDGFHDYASVIQDFAAVSPCLQIGARVAFHDYADYFPGVVDVVHELVAAGNWSEEARAGTMVLLRRST